MMINWENLLNYSIPASVISILTMILKNKDLRLFTMQVFTNFFKIIFGNKSLTHYIFGNEEQMLNGIKTIKLSNELKTDLFQILLTIQTKTTLKYLRLWILKRQKDMRGWKRSELLSSMITLMEEIKKGDNNDVVLGYEFEIERAYVKKYGRTKGQSYFSIVYLNNFKPYQSKNFKYMESFFNKIFLYENMTNLQLVDMFLDRNSMLLTMASDDGVEVMFDINGGLEKYKNYG